MRKFSLMTGILGMLLLLWVSPVFSAGATVEDLEDRIDSILDEFEAFKTSGSGAAGPDRVKLHGYGELHFNHDVQSETSELDQHRFVIGIHAMLADWIHLNAEIDFEHAAQKLEFEFGYLDFLFDPKFNARAGVILVPMGFLNEFHEPPLFWTVERPRIQNVMIPTTWSAGGFGIFGTLFEGFNYRIYAIDSLQSIRFDKPGGSSGGCGGHGTVNPGGACGRFTSSGIRGGRREKDEALANDFAAVGRFEYTGLIEGLQLGFSFFAGDTTHNIIPEDGFTTIFEGDVRFRKQWFEMDATIVSIHVDDAGDLNAYCARVKVKGCSGGIAEEMFGWNIEVGIHVLQLAKIDTGHDLVPFFLFEQYDTQYSMPSGTPADPSKDVDVYTMGISYLPIPQVAIKTDYQQLIMGDGTTTEKVNVGIAYMYN